MLRKLTELLIGDSCKNEFDKRIHLSNLNVIIDQVKMSNVRLEGAKSEWVKSFLN